MSYLKFFHDSKSFKSEADISYSLPSADRKRRKQNSNKLNLENTLLDALRSAKSPIQGSKLSLVGYRINKLDKVPFKISLHILVLYLSNNDIICIDNISQFQKCQQLSLANNLIRYLDHLKPLKGLEKTLEKLSLEGITLY